VLSSIASDCMVDDGECLNAVEIFWTPSDRSEVLGRLDVVTDFPEIIELDINPLLALPSGAKVLDARVVIE